MAIIVHSENKITQVSIHSALDITVKSSIMKIKLYKVSVYQAYRADEEGIRWFTHKPSDTEYYKHEILEEVEKELPKGVTYDEEFMTFDDNGHDCQMVNNNDDSVSLVSSERIIDWF